MLNQVEENKMKKFLGMSEYVYLFIISAMVIPTFIFAVSNIGDLVFANKYIFVYFLVLSVLVFTGLFKFSNTKVMGLVKLMYFFILGCMAILFLVIGVAGIYDRLF